MNGRERSSADLCRANGWGVGTVLELIRKTDAPSEWRLVITAVGEELAIGRAFSRKVAGRDWEDFRLPEGTFDPSAWRKVEATPQEARDLGYEMDSLCGLWALRKYGDRTDDDGRLICKLSKALAEVNHRVFELEEALDEPQAADPRSGEGGAA